MCDYWLEYYHYKPIIGARSKPSPTMRPPNTVDTSVVLFEAAELAQMFWNRGLVTVVLMVRRNLLISLASNRFKAPYTDNATWTRRGTVADILWPPVANREPSGWISMVNIGLPSWNTQLGFTSFIAEYTLYT